MGKVMISILSGFSQKEIEDLSQRVKIGLHARIKEGKWRGGTPPYGYRYNRQTEKLEIDDKEASVVRIIFERYLALQTLNAVKNHLNNHAIPSKKGLKWSVKVVRDVLGKEIYTGHYWVKDIEIEDEVLNIVDDDTFQETQKLLKERAKFRPKVRNKDLVEGDGDEYASYLDSESEPIEPVPVAFTKPGGFK